MLHEATPQGPAARVHREGASIQQHVFRVGSIDPAKGGVQRPGLGWGPTTRLRVGSNDMA